MVALPIMTNNDRADLDQWRKLASKAGDLSAAEKMAADKGMRRLVAQFAQALDDSNRQAAVSQGMGATYDAAMSEWGRAMAQQAIRKRLADALMEYGKAAIKSGVAGTAGTAAGYGVYRALRD